MLSDSDLLTRVQVQKLLGGVGLSTLKRWHAQGVLRATIKLGPRLVRYDRKVVEAFIVNRELQALSANPTPDSEVGE